MRANKKTLASIAVVGTVAAALAFMGTSNPGPSPTFLQATSSSAEMKAFQDFIQANNKNYQTSEEFSQRFAIFTSNLAIIASHDSASAGFQLGMN